MWLDQWYRGFFKVRSLFQSHWKSRHLNLRYGSEEVTDNSKVWGGAMSTGSPGKVQNKIVAWQLKNLEAKVLE